MHLVMEDRDKISCAQSGPKGPPWAGDATKGAGFFVRWLPWNWYSVDGTGWCYDAAWDEFRKDCGHADWYGIQWSTEASTDTLSWSQIFGVLGVAVLLAARASFLDWLSRETRRVADAAEEQDGASPDDHLPPSQLNMLSKWWRVGEAWPWNWRGIGHISFVGSLIGFVAALATPFQALVLQAASYLLRQDDRATS